ncbi:MAG: response regulator [Sphaerochaeta sp.]|nr:response regulator [Sphaerochaeta sp.]
MYRVVVVEDSQLLRKGIIFTTDWNALQCEVVGEAENGLEGFKLILEVQPDIVITDIRMPGLDGIQMIERLQPQCDALFIILTAYDSFEYARKALHLGVVDYISKPLDEQEFQMLIARTCDKIAKRKEYEKVQVQMERMDDSRIMLFQEYLRGEQSVQESHVSRAVKFIEMSFSSDIGVQQIAQELQMSESYLSRLFKDVTGYTIGDYLLNYRIKQACLLLNDGSAKIYEVANQVGFRDQRYFSVLFKKIVGLTPREFQNKLN